MLMIGVARNKKLDCGGYFYHRDPGFKNQELLAKNTDSPIGEKPLLSDGGSPTPPRGLGWDHP